MEHLPLSSAIAPCSQHLNESAAWRYAYADMHALRTTFIVFQVFEAVAPCVNNLMFRKTVLQGGIKNHNPMNHAVPSFPEPKNILLQGMLRMADMA